MLRRRSHKKSRSGLTRRRSASSVHGVEAYTRAQHRTMTGVLSLFPATPESSPRHPRTQWSAPGKSGEEGAELRHRQSVRFVGSCSALSRNQQEQAGRGLGGRQPDEAGTQGEQGKDGLRSPTDPDAQQRPSPPRRAPPPVPLQKIATSYLDALAAEDEYYTPEDDVASAPSSFRRLHRSKSMFTEPQGTSTSRRFFRSDPHDRKSTQETPALRAPKSMSFLTGRKSQSRSSTSRDGGAHDPRSPALPNLPEDGPPASTKGTPREPGYMSSALFASLTRQTDLRLRKSLRSSSPAPESEKPNPVPHKLPDEPSTLRLKARHASRSLRVKLKNLFTAPKPEDATPSLPCQHIESRKTHATPFQGSSIDEPPVPESRGVVSRSLAKIPYLEPAPHGLVRSSKASLESLASEADRNISNGSSLTSWAHSGPSTLSSQEQEKWREWEKQRLSIIGENGAHAPSTSIRRRRALGSGLFQPPERTAEVPVTRPVVDSQRIYSALVKRMRGTEHGLAEGGSESRESDCVVPANEEAGRRSLSRTPDTIRRVIPERKYSRLSGYATTPTRASTRADLSQNRYSWDSQPPSPPLPGPTPRAQGYQSTLDEDFTDARLVSDATDVSSHHTEADWRSSVTDSPGRHLFRTTSPYRRALGKSMQEEQDAWAQYASHDSDTETQVHHNLGSGRSADPDSDSAKNLEYSESIYSSDEGGFGSRYGERGANRITASDTPAMYRAVDYRDPSTASSIDWKTWLSANIAKFEPSPSPSKPSEPPFAHPRTFPNSQFASASLRGHVREQAQIHGDCDTDDNEEDDNDDGDVFETPRRVRNYPSATAPLGRVEPNVLKPSPLRRSVNQQRASPPASPKIAPSVMMAAAGAAAGNVLLVENERSPTRAAPPPPPPPECGVKSGVVGGGAEAVWAGAGWW
ncbi:hypothetical protein C8A05DRAFT_41360 [Staphylotrichum tortipilum]|uniref:Uncharacterized protein n=1 Tax=Staphylotrichum tortipilum TaxID=2831512 RepID=A0AAN6MSR2_9PEZI|nr:hypothetical protein C8A05DRAFT_41360 [Staphylotrichum longicolle]